MVIGSAPAKADLRAIHDYIARDSLQYAKKVTHELRAKTEALAELPNIERVVPELGDERVRELALYSYRIIYRSAGAHTYILAIIHKRRELQPDATIR